ncbi:MAG: hypothetical protein OQK57_07415 [Ignavibacteriaceae bacterium]|jgi:hypothetical protein|nr:hypothetical protein [Ignavibacteriaceae bacterium]
MDKNELIELKSLVIDLNDQNSVSSMVQTFAELKNSGYSQVTVDIKTSPEQELNKSQLDLELFSKIKAVQELPDWVVINLILAAGKLKDSSFKERIFSE